MGGLAKMAQELTQKDEVRMNQETQEFLVASQKIAALTAWLATRLSPIIEDLDRLQVHTFVSPDPANAGYNPDTGQFDREVTPIAQTIVSLDGDISHVVPVGKSNNEAIKIDEQAIEFHNQLVELAMSYRAESIKMITHIVSPLMAEQDE